MSNLYPNLPLESKKMLLTIFYLFKMEETGLLKISNGRDCMTVKGFDLSFDLIHEGLKLSQKEMTENLLGFCLLNNVEITEKQINEVSIMMYAIQERGIDKVKEEVEIIKKGLNPWDF